MEEKNNPLICDPEEGFCELPEEEASGGVTSTDISKPVKVIYFTDPICSSCWGIEPQLRKLKLTYGEVLEIEYRMGGLLPDWSYDSGGISQPSDVASHWDKVSMHYDMPIDGDVWLEDPLSSSYPPSIAFKAAQIQGEKKALVFLREIREMVFLQKKNITKWEYLSVAAEKAGLDVEKLKNDVEGEGKRLFEEDLKLAKEWGVRGFPSMFFTDKLGNKEFVYGRRPYSNYESTILKLFPTAAKTLYKKNWKALFAKFSSYTANEFAVLSEVSREDSEKQLDALFEEGKLKKLLSKNGAMWRLKVDAVN